MKAKINGIEVEGTPIESLMFQKGFEVKTTKEIAPVQEQPLTTTPIRAAKMIVRKEISYKKKGQWFTPAEDRLIKRLVKRGLTTEQVAEHFPNRPLITIVDRIYRLNLTKKVANITIKPRRKGSNGARIWMEKRTKSLMKEYQYDYEKAQTMARTEWSKRCKFDQVVERNKQRRSEQSTSTVLVSFESINQEVQPILATMLQHIIRAGQGRLMYDESSYPLAINGVAHWKRFLEEFLLKLVQINSYVQALGKKGKFSIENNYVLFHQ